jgi:BMFP domain-containing protein YqiC
MPHCLIVLKTNAYRAALFDPAPYWCAPRLACPVLVGETQIFAIGRLIGLAFRRMLRYQSSMNKESIENLAGALADSVPEGLRSMRKELEENFRSVLRSGIGKLDLVTRDEFEVQEAVLARTREKLAVLEARLAELEEKQQRNA